MAKNTPFSDITVLDFSRYLPGGYATQVLADLGATVIKVEDTGLGDFMRHDYPTMGGGISYYITALGRNKKSISLNLKNEEVVDWFLKMAAEADIIVESFRPGVTKKLGIDYESVKKINPGIIYASISGYGAEDPRSKKAQHDLNMQAQSGYLSVNHGSTSPLHLCDLSSAMVTGQSLLAALYARTVTGEGAYIDISMFDCFVWWNSLLDSRWCFNGGECKRDDLEYPSTAYNVYDTKDGGKLALGMVEPKFWEPFCDAIGHPEIKPDGLKRRWEAPESFTKVEETIKSKTTDEWVEWLEDKDFCIAKVNSKSEAVEQITRENPEALAWVEFPRVGRVLQTGLPHHISTIPVEISEFTEVSPLGADTAEYLKKVGADDATIERLKGEGGIRLGDDIEPEEDRAPVKPA
jgi:crotonobetainyl-CoA:carnitine CoA-transferase CaiB-like acyl-CoA transferase